jgi:hypothetical protein
MNDDQIFIKEYKELKLQLSRKIFECKFKNILNQIDEYNDNLNLNPESFQQSVYNWLYTVDKSPRCPITDELVSFNKNTFKYNIYRGKGIRSDESQKKITKKRLDKVDYKKIYNDKKEVTPVKITFENLHKLLIDEFSPIENFGAFCVKFLSRFPEIYNYIISNEFLSECDKLQEKIYLVINNMKSAPRCSYDKISKCNFLGFTKGYSQYGKDYRRARKLKRQNLLDDIDISSIYSNVETIKQLQKILIEIENSGISNRNMYQSITSRDAVLTKSVLEYTKQYPNIKFSNRIHLILNGLPQVSKSYIKPVFYSLDKGYDMRFENSRGKSKPEKELLKWLSDYITDLKASDRTVLDGKEIDIYSEQYKIGIEFNGIYWHNYDIVGKNSMIHKTMIAKSKGVKLLHVLETEWLSKQDIIKSLILSKFSIYTNKIYARKCEVKVIDSKTSNLFLEENHLQGRDNSKVKLGLFYNDELTSVMTFGCRKITGNNDMELIRFCNKKYTTVIGGASKLFKFFIKNYAVDKIKTYANLRLSDGELYEKMGFAFVNQSEPNYWYFKSQSPSKLELKHRSGFQKHRLPSILENFDSSKTEWENMKEHGYYKIYDCGNLVFEYVNTY